MLHTLQNNYILISKNNCEFFFLSCSNAYMQCTIASKINVTPKGVYLPVSKLHSILVVANLLAHNNISQICYCGQISLQSAAVNCSFSDNLTPLGVTFILLAMVRVQIHTHFICCLKIWLYIRVCSCFLFT